MRVWFPSLCFIGLICRPSLTRCYSFPRQLCNFFVCNAIDPIFILAMLNHLLTHSLNLMDIKRRSAPPNSSSSQSPPSPRRPASRKPLSPRKQKRNARKKHGNGSALSTQTPGDADRENDPASATQSPNDADRMAKLLALKKQWEEETSPEAQAKKDAEKDTQCQKRCGVFFQGPSNVVSL